MHGDSPVTKPRASEREWEAWYRALKAKHPDAYRKAIGYCEAICINHNVQAKVAAEYETAAVMMACEILGVTP